VRDGETGLLAAPGDAADLGEKLARMLGDPALRRRLGAAARRHAEASFDWRDVARRYEAALGDVVGATAVEGASRDAIRSWFRARRARRVS